MSGRSPAHPDATREPPANGLRAAGGKTFGWSAAAWDPIERSLVRIGDHLNPILVKETRQALKSWQFTLTFVLLLATCWVVTIGGMAWIGPSIYYSAAGSTMLLAYYVILAALLVVFVPFSAFRSLTAEREDNTYELLSITTLRPRQIIGGKLGSSVAQMLVYFSAIAPCLAFTYLLRGVDLPTIVMLLVYTFLLSLGLSLIGLLIAALRVQRFGQVFLAVSFVVFLLQSLWSATAIAFELIMGGYGVIRDSDFWIANLAFATAYVTTFALAYFAASALVSFPSENRSTPLRLVMLVQQTAWIGWAAYGWISVDYENEALYIAAMFATLYWYVMGTLLTGERSEMSQRTRRQLPKSRVGRTLFSWLYPGPACGFMFVTANLSAVAVLCLAVLAYNRLAPSASPGWQNVEIIESVVIAWSYVVAYLGLGRLAIAALRRVAKVTMLASVLIHLLLLLAGSGIPMTIQLLSVDLRNAGYTLLQITSPIYTLHTVIDTGLPSDASAPLIIVPGAALCVLLLNMPGVVRELRQVRVAAPQRVLEDEADLQAPPAPGSPWDEPE